MRKNMLCAALVVAGSLCRAAELQSIAVSDFEARGIEAHEAAIIAERFRGELVKSGLFKVMERGQMETVLKEQGFQQTGVCTDASCVIEIGQLLAVGKMVIGSVGKIGRMFTLNVKLVDISTGEILLSLDEDVRGSIEDVFLTAVPSMSKALSREAATMKVMVGYLDVDSEPTGATVKVDQRNIGTTPLSGVEIEAGQHTIALSLENYAPREKTITLAKQSRESLSFTLSPTGEFLKRRKEEGESKRRRLKNVLRWTSGGVAVLGLVAAGWYHKDWTGRDSDYHATRDPESAAALHEDIEDVQSYRTVALIVGGLGAVGLGVSFVF